jgi:hypothetical protein
MRATQGMTLFPPQRQLIEHPNAITRRQVRQQVQRRTPVIGTSVQLYLPPGR